MDKISIAVITYNCKLGAEKLLIDLEKQKDEPYVCRDYFLLSSVLDRINGSIEGYGIVFIEENAYSLLIISALYEHAQQHNYLKQKSFLHFIEKSSDE